VRQYFLELQKNKKYKVELLPAGQAGIPKVKYSGKSGLNLPDGSQVSRCLQRSKEIFCFNNLPVISEAV
jgi:hypothetical protein